MKLKKYSSSKSIGALIFSCLVQGCSAYQLSPPPKEEIKKDAHRIVNKSEIVAVTSKISSVRKLRKRAIEAGYSLRETEHLDSLELIQLILLIPEHQTGPGAIAELESFAPGVTAGVNHAYELQSSQGRRYAKKMIGWPGRGCKSLARIGLIDDRINEERFNSDDIQIKTKSFTRSSALSKNHGNKVASVFLQETNLTDVELYVGAVVANHENAKSVASVDAILKALNWLKSENVQLVNISLAGPYNKILDRGIQSSVNKGMILVSAVGNSGKDASPRYPAAFNDVIAVTAVDAEKNIYPMAVQGKYVDIAAPGVNVLLDNGKSSVYATGTSYAAPFVTAVIASSPMLISARNLDELIKILAEAAEDLGEAGKDKVFGAGLVRKPESCATPA